MYDPYAFRDIIRRKGMSLKQVSELIEVSGTTMQRKLSGKTDFTRSEIEKCRLFMKDEDINRIFFAENVS